MSQGNEPSIIDYARFHDLIRDHLQVNPLENLTAPHDIRSEFEDNENLFQIRADCVTVPDERLTADLDTASLLSSVFALAQNPPSRNDDTDGFDIHKFRRMKLEIPLLRTDPEIDVLRFVPPQIVPDLKNEFLPLETVDEEADEGFEFPTRYHNLPDEHTRKLKAEKLEVTRDALAFLHEALNSHHEGGKHEYLEGAELPYTRKTKILPLSPPLLPMSPTVLPYVPSDTGRIESISDPTSPSKDELEEAERIVFADDRIVPTKKEAEDGWQNSDPMLLDTDSLGDIYSPLKNIDQLPSSPPVVRRSLRDRKVEVPLSPLRSDQPPPWERKHVSFSDVLNEVIHDIPPPMLKPENVSSDDIDAFFEETIRPTGEQAQSCIEREQLVEADTVSRLTVPIMDFSKPIVPWEKETTSPDSSNLERWKETMCEIKDVHFKNHVWPMSGKAERELRWTPFPAALGKVQEQESISDDGLLGEYLAQPERVDVYTLTWKPDGLRLFDELAEPEEKLEEGVFPEENDIDSLVRKRKYELQADYSRSPNVNGDNRPAKVRSRDCDVDVGQLELEVGPTTHTFSALTALNSYMSVRKGEIEEPRHRADKHFPYPPKKANSRASSLEITKAPDTQRSVPDIVSMPSPAIEVPTSPVLFIVSASFLRNRSLARHIQHLYPSADFIERDFNLHAERCAEPPSKASLGPPTQSTMSDEADMLLSPGVGLIWTTSQKIKQRSLPGQIARSGVKERIARASLRYEKLIILIHEGRITTDIPAVETTDLNNSDCEALIELSNFCSTLQSEVQTIFVAGGEEDLAKRIVAMMVKYGISEPNLRLLQDETHWEIFLRRVGMNAFAAQAILADLTEPSGRTERGISVDHRLAAFVKMSAEERFARYETLLGGRQLLARVSQVLDPRW